VLTTWHETRRKDRDLILKLHTGQGKTLIGLLMLQSQLNAGQGPALYLCPNYFLVNQTCRQAQQFGIHIVKLERELPDEFTEGKAILVTVPHKLFNAETKFGLNPKSQSVGTLLLDDAHACVDIIRDQFVIRLENDQGAYTALRDLFAPDLETQGAGTCAELICGDYEALLPVPYWAWQEKQREVVKILVEHRDTKSIRFVWPLLKDILSQCTCLFSGRSLEIGPVLPPLDMFGSYAKATHRIFMSATVANDSFLVKGLGMGVETVRSPLLYENETWTGEKLILIPSLIDDSLDRSELVNQLAKPRENRPYGLVALTPSYPRSADWAALGATVVKREEIDAVVEALRAGQRDAAVVFANRYDGIDLPDAMCRILVLDSKPFAESLQERYLERCLGDTEMLAMAVARKIEQGLGRSVRGEKDYCVILLIGPDLVKHVRTKTARRYLSQQTQHQIEIGLEVVEMGREGITEEMTPSKAFVAAMSQCLRRDDGWKEFYVTRMDEMPRSTTDTRMLDQFTQERESELKFIRGDIEGAVQVAQNIANSSAGNESLQGWYLQEAARYEYARSKTQSNVLQVSAHKHNPALLRPREGVQFKRITLMSQRRIENCQKWISERGTPEELLLIVNALLSDLHFGVDSERFESAVNELGVALGFTCDRPDRMWKEGPDNLWALRDNQYLLIECKNKVEVTRPEIHKDETDQMNRSSAWFKKNYGNADVTRMMIIPTKKVSGAAAFVDPTVIMTESKLDALRGNVRAFFREFTNIDLRDVALSYIQELFAAHNLGVDDILKLYGDQPRNQRREK
jgi:replicative superfamily II helicase